MKILRKYKIELNFSASIKFQNDRKYGSGPKLALKMCIGKSESDNIKMKFGGSFSESYAIQTVAKLARLCALILRYFANLLHESIHCPDVITVMKQIAQTKYYTIAKKAYD